MIREMRNEKNKNKKSKTAFNVLPVYYKIITKQKQQKNEIVKKTKQIKFEKIRKKITTNAEKKLTTKQNNEKFKKRRIRGK